MLGYCVKTNLIVHTLQPLYHIHSLEFVSPLNVLGAHLKWIKPNTAVDIFVSSVINWFLSYKNWALVAGTEINFVGMEQFFVPSLILNGSKTLLIHSVISEHLESIRQHFAPPLPLMSNPGLEGNEQVTNHYLDSWWQFPCAKLCASNGYSVIHIKAETKLTDIFKIVSSVFSSMKMCVVLKLMKQCWQFTGM